MNHILSHDEYTRTIFELADYLPKTERSDLNDARQTMLNELGASYATLANPHEVFDAYARSYILHTSRNIGSFTKDDVETLVAGRLEEFKKGRINEMLNTMQQTQTSKKLNDAVARIATILKEEAPDHVREANDPIVDQIMASFSDKLANSAESARTIFNNVLRIDEHSTGPAASLYTKCHITTYKKSVSKELATIDAARGLSQGRGV